MVLSKFKNYFQPLVVALLSFLSLYPSTRASAAEAMCEMRKDFLQTHLEERVTDSEEILTRYAKRSVDVIVFGETHYEPSQQRQAELIDFIHSVDPSFDCVFMELTEEALGDRMRLLSGIPRYLESPLHIERRFFTSIKANGMELVPVDDRSGLESVQDLMVSADPILDPRVKAELETRILTDRNRIMADNIYSSLVSGRCTRGVMIIGKSHLFSHSDGVEVEPITESLWANGVESRAVNIEDASIHPTEEPISSPALCFDQCEWNPELPQSEVAFVHEESDAPFIEESKFSSRATEPYSGTWGDFDATIVVPTEVETCQVQDETVDI